MPSLENKIKLDVLGTRRAQFLSAIFSSIFQNYFLSDKIRSFNDSDNQLYNFLWVELYEGHPTTTN